jgi:hypothetical protein
LGKNAADISATGCSCLLNSLVAVPQTLRRITNE